MRTFLLIALLAGAAEAGAGEETADRPAWVDALIASFEAAPVANPPLSITRFTYHEATVYFVPARCCDIPSRLYDAEGTPLCAPDGGFTGRGDGRCRDFREERQEERLIWRDVRGRTR